MPKQEKRKTLLVSQNVHSLVKNTCPSSTKLHVAFTDTIVRLGVEEYKRLKKFNKNVSHSGTLV